MSEHPKVKFARDYCKKNHIRYQIKGANDVLYIYDPMVGRYTQRCYSLLNFANNDEIARFIDKETK